MPDAGPPSPITTVSLTFDDTLLDQYQARSILADHGMHATFYTISSRVGVDANSMTLAQLQALAADGNEIGGHTLSHPDLSTLNVDDAKREICNGRATLLSLGFGVKNFAYPFGSPPAQSPFAAQIEQIIADCGFLTARGTGDILSPGSCIGCPFADSIPPGRSFHVRTPDSVKLGTSLETMQGYVTQAEDHGGGWVVIVMHHICDTCNPYSIPRQQLTDFLDWLQPRSALGTVVKTIDEVIGGPLLPKVDGPPKPLPSPGSNLLINGSLEDDVNHDGLPDCWMKGGSGTNTATFAITSDAADGLSAEHIQIQSLTSGARRLVNKQDTGLCAPAVNKGHGYSASAMYKSSVPARFIAYYLDPTNRWIEWAQGPFLPARSQYSQASWPIPQLPDTAKAISIGMSIFAVGDLYLDQVALRDQDLTPPEVTVSSPTDGSVINGHVTITASATDAGGLDHVAFLFNGVQLPGTVTQSGNNYSVDWDTTTTRDGTGAVTARGYDLAGNIGASASREVIVANIPPPDNVPPTISLTAPPAGSTVDGVVTISADAADNVAVQHVSFFIDGLLLTNADTPPYVSSWDSSQATEHPTVLSATAVDTSGNQTTVAVQVLVDRTPPTVSLLSPSDGATVSGDVVLSADTQDNVGLDHVEFLVNGASAGRAMSSPWAVPFDTRGIADGSALTVAAIAVDRSGHSTSSTQVAVIVDNSAPDIEPPVSTAMCNDLPCVPTYYRDRVSVNIATSDTGGSGVSAILYTVDGSLPEINHGFGYTAPLAFTSDVNLNFRAFDNAGNLEPVQSVALLVDTAPPSLAVTCNGSQCTSGWFSSNVGIVVTSTDSGSSGINQILYSLDGSDPTGGSGSPYSAPFSLNTDAALRVASTDNAGNAAVFGPVQVRIDTTTPAIVASCNGAACTDNWSATSVLVALTGVPTGSSGIAGVRYTLDGSPPQNGLVYTGPITISSVAQLRALAINQAGTASSELTQLLQVDTIPPSISTTSPANGSNVTGSPVPIVANPSDNVAVTRVRFFLDNKQLGTRVAAPWKWNWDTTSVAKGAHVLLVKAEDAAGNSSAAPPLNVTLR